MRLAGERQKLLRAAASVAGLSNSRPLQASVESAPITIAAPWRCDHAHRLHLGQCRGDVCGEACSPKRLRVTSSSSTPTARSRTKDRALVRSWRREGLAGGEDEGAGMMAESQAGSSGTGRHRRCG